MVTDEYAVEDVRAVIVLRNLLHEMADIVLCVGAARVGAARLAAVARWRYGGGGGGGTADSGSVGPNVASSIMSSRLSVSVERYARSECWCQR